MTAESLEAQSFFGSTQQSPQQVYKLLTGPRLLRKLKETLGANNMGKDSLHNVQTDQIILQVNQTAYFH